MAIGQKAHHGLALQDVLLKCRVEACCNDGHMDLTLVPIINYSSKDDVGRGVCQAGHNSRHSVHLLQSEVLAASDVVDNPSCSLYGALYERRGGCSLQAE